MPDPLQHCIELIGQCSGLKPLPFQLKPLQQTLEQLCIDGSFDTLDQLLTHLQQTPLKQNPQLQKLVNLVTINESTFFRDETRTRFLQHYIPALLKKKRKTQNNHIRVWSAGCAQGQELYTVAMLLEQHLDQTSDCKIELIGTDINSDEIVAATRADYSIWSLRTTGQYYRQRYFSHENKRYQLCEQLKNNTRFFCHNLQTDNLPDITQSLLNVDLILCCNVLVYFEQQHIPAILAKLSRCLHDEGVMILSATDYYYEQMASHFVAQTFEGYPIFAKRLEPNITVPPQIKSAQPPVQLQQVLSEATDKMANGQWQQVIELVGNRPQNVQQHPALTRLEANALANTGQLTQAITICQKGLAQDSQDKVCYLIMALALMGLGQLADAESALTTALFLDPAFVDAHYCKASLARKQGKNKHCLGCLKTAARLCQQRNDDDVTCLYPQISMAQFKAELDLEIRVLSPIT